MCSIKKKVEKLRKSNNKVVISWIASKMSFAFGAGILLAFYYQWTGWEYLGWIFILLSILVGIPAIKVAFKK